MSTKYTPIKRVKCGTCHGLGIASVPSGKGFSAPRKRIKCPTCNKGGF